MAIKSSLSFSLTLGVIIVSAVLLKHLIWRARGKPKHFELEEDFD